MFTTVSLLQASDIFITTMADDEVATKAPESDVQQAPTSAEQQSVFPGDTKAQEGPSMGVRRCY